MRISFKTFGCRLNQAETARFERDFLAAGWQVVPYPAAADAVVIHGCAVTRIAERECLRLARGMKRRATRMEQPEPYVVLVGCVVEADATRLRVAGVDLLVPRQDKERLAEIVAARLESMASLQDDRGRICLTDPTCLTDSACRYARALLKVQDGCDFRCAYCIVPHTRGAPVSRPWQVVLDEAWALARAGFQELVIAGCNVACYRDNRRGLAELLAAIAALDEVRRVRLSSIEPATCEREVIDLMATCHKLCRYLHLPLQSGDAGVLAAMRRRYTPEQYTATVRHAVARIPDLGLGSDVIVGFPGESAEAFANTLRLIADLPFSNLHVFPFSERPGTPAATFGHGVPMPVRKARATVLIRLRGEKRQVFAATFVGRPVEVLIERRSKDGCGHGWSGQYLDCRVAGVERADIGRVLSFQPTAAMEGGLIGRSLSDSAV